MRGRVPTAASPPRAPDLDTRDPGSQPAPNRWLLRLRKSFSLPRTFIPIVIPKTRANGVGARLHQHALHPRARRATMQLFGKSADPKEQMRKWKKEMRGEQRKVDRQINRAHPPDPSPPRAVPTRA